MSPLLIILYQTSGKDNSHATTYHYNGQKNEGKPFDKESLRNKISITWVSFCQEVTRADLTWVSEPAHEAVHPNEKEDHICHYINHEREHCKGFCYEDTQSGTCDLKQCSIEWNREYKTESISNVFIGTIRFLSIGSCIMIVTSKADFRVAIEAKGIVAKYKGPEYTVYYGN